MYSTSFARLPLLGAVTMALLFATGCGGGGGNGIPSGVGSGGTGYVQGTVTKGPLSGATVTAYAITNSQMGAPLGTASTDASGNFKVSMGTYAGPLMLQVSGGTYLDEAASALMTMAAGDVMTAVLPTVAAGADMSGIQVTPVTAMAQMLAQRMTGGLTDANITAANTAMGNYFMVSDIIHVQPMSPLVASAGSSATQDAQNYGMTLAAMSKWAQLQGMVNSSAMVTAMMNDASDGVLDGKAGTAPIPMGGMGGGMMMPSNAGTTGMGGAMNAFMNSPQNKSGVAPSVLIGKLNGSDGRVLTSGPAMVNGMLSGTAFNGVMSKATVTAHAISGGVMGAQIASAATDEKGNFTIPMGDYSGSVMLQVSAGTYLDEATKASMTMAAGDVMTAVMPALASGATVSGVWVTPVTSIAQARAAGMSGGMTEANILLANQAVGAYFAVNDILRTMPMNPLIAGSADGASQDSMNYGMTLAAMSQYAKNLNMAVSTTMLTGMMSDAADGVLDGKKDSTPITMSMGGMMGGSVMMPTAVTSGLGTAMLDFMNSVMNRSGVKPSDMADLMQKFNSSTGKL